ncbi:hypothetical protein [Enterococcus mundtii]|uniref:hypothetical protein n=1 Tax=Enterococcus mundtii TaxID=53346 RepID=UPI001CCC1A93|nr:hypothetical protein [Enterococcus mundtii]UBM07228.1 hypothetical protein K9N66_15265 [Enterococcus mundtii]
MEFLMNIKEKILNSPYFNKVSYLFEESFMTYAIGAYRSSYITSYVGFLQQIRQNIIIYKENPYFGIIEKKDTEEEEQYRSRIEKKWDRLKKDLKDVDNWENTLITALNENIDTNILRLNNAERTKLSYFKNIRNDAVHDKTNGITIAQLQSLWEFIIEYAHRTRIGEDKESFLKNYQEIAEWYRKPGDIPEYKLRVIEESFYLLTEKEKIEILRFFYDSFRNSFSNDIYTLHTKEVFNHLFEDHRSDMYNLVSSDHEIALFSIFVINNFDVACLTWSRDDSDSVLRLNREMIDQIINFIFMQDTTLLKDKIINFINVLSEPYKLDPVRPISLRNKLDYFFRELLTFEILELKELKDIARDSNLTEILIDIALESVEKSYNFTGYNGRIKKIDTFSWDDININMYYIIYISDLSLESEYKENERVKEVFERLKRLFEQNNSGKPNKDTNFLSNFSTLFEKLNDFPQLKSTLEESISTMENTSQKKKRI